MYNEYMGSASGLEPQIGYRPNGFLGGMQYARQEQDYQGQLGLQNLTRMLGLIKQQNELQEYGQNAPVREAERTFKVEDFGQQTRAAPSKYNAQITKDDLTTKYAPKEADQKDWERGQKRQAASHELMGGYLESLLDPKNGLPPAEAVSKFKNEVIPQVESLTGEKMPDWMRGQINTPQDLQRLQAAIDRSQKFREQMEIKRIGEEGLNKRNTDNNQNHIDVENIRARWHELMANRERTSSAQEKRKLIDEWIQAELYNMISARGGTVSEQTKRDLENAATRRVLEATLAGNQQGKAMGAVQTEGGKLTEREKRFDRFTASPLPYNKDGKIDSSKLVDGDAYKAADGTVGRWDRNARRFVPIEQNGPNFPNGIPTDQVIRP
jgi:hypothetical protein